MFNKEVLEKMLAMLPVASKDVTRYHINGVYLVSTDTDVTLVATDGYCLVEHKFKNVTCPKGKYMLRHDMARAAKDVLKDNKNRNDLGLLVGLTHTVLIETYTGDYPDYKAVIPQHKVEASISFNADYLIAVAEALKTYKWANPNVTLVFDPTNSRSAIRVTNESDSAGLGIVMPRREKKSEDIASELNNKLAASESKKSKVGVA